MTPEMVPPLASQSSIGLPLRSKACTSASFGSAGDVSLQIEPPLELDTVTLVLDVLAAVDAFDDEDDEDDDGDDTSLVVAASLDPPPTPVMTPLDELSLTPPLVDAELQATHRHPPTRKNATRIPFAYHASGTPRKREPTRDPT